MWKNPKGNKDAWGTNRGRCNKRLYEIIILHGLVFTRYYYNTNILIKRERSEQVSTIIILVHVKPACERTRTQWTYAHESRAYLVLCTRPIISWVQRPVIVFLYIMPHEERKELISGHKLFYYLNGTSNFIIIITSASSCVNNIMWQEKEERKGPILILRSEACTLYLHSYY